jgi:hypothetical protein
MKIIHVHNHWEVITDSGLFVMSADTRQEADSELELYLKENDRKSA